MSMSMYLDRIQYVWIKNEHINQIQTKDNFVHVLVYLIHGNVNVSYSW